MSFLNIGSGTGYFSCLVGYLIKSHGVSHGIELHEDLLDFAKDHVKEFLAHRPQDTSEICPPLMISGNGFRLDPNQLKYDRYNNNRLSFIHCLKGFCHKKDFFDTL